MKVLQSGVYKNYPDKELVQAIDDIFVSSNYGIGYDTTTPIMVLFGTGGENERKDINIAVGKFNKACIRKDYPTYISNILKVDYDTLYNAVCAYNVENVRLPGLLYFSRLFQVLYSHLTVWHIHLAGEILLAVAVVLWIKEKTCPYVLLGISGGIISIIITTVVGTYSEWGRTMISVLPFYYAGVMAIFSMILQHCIGAAIKEVKDGEKES